MNTIVIETKLLQLISTLNMLANTLAESEEIASSDPAFVASVAHDLAEEVLVGYTEMVQQLRGALTAHAEAVDPLIA